MLASISEHGITPGFSMTINDTEHPTLDLSIAEITRRTRAGEMTAREITDAHIRRIEATRAALNHVIFPTFDDARRTADELDARRQKGEPLGALHGVPITIKESFDVAGTPTTNGLTNRRDHIAGEDAPIVSRLRQAGAVILGKTNLPQLCMMTETDNPVYGRTNNPWNLERAPGGSSGGCAAAVATGGAVFSLGSDIGGSVRIPAHHCGVHALKPTNDRFTMRGHAIVTIGQRAIVAQPGILARHVRDIELAMRVLCDDAGAPNLSPAANGSPLVPAPPAFRPSLHDPDSPPDLRGLRLAVCTDDKFFTASPAIRRATREAALAAREAGAEIEDWTPPDVSEAMRIYFGLLLGDGMRPARELLKRQP
jgi:fatty acid amide hydrolase